MVYREQAFVERCFCRAPATRPCRCCGRARCDAHLERALCNRCTQFVGRELAKRANGAWFAAGAIGVVTTLGLLAMGFVGSVLVGLPAALCAGLGYKRLQRARTIRLLGPVMSASKGELPAPPRDTPLVGDSCIGSSNNIPPAGY